MSISIDEIYDLFIWDASYSEEEYDAREQAGIVEASKLKNLFPFLQPIIIPPQKSKSVWEPCAKVISMRSDDELNPYLISLFEWLQDMNWPGAEIIFDRLSQIPLSGLEMELEFSRKRAIETNHEFWLTTLDELKNKYQLKDRVCDPE